MDLQIEGRRALILGGSKGLGRAVAEALAAEGVSVGLVARDTAALDRTCGEINSRGAGHAIGLAADLNDWASVELAIARAEEQLGGSIEILLNNSGGPSPSSASGVRIETWRNQFETMVLSYIRITDRLLPAMKDAGWGRILNVASISVIQPITHLGVSNTLRSAVVGWAKTLSNEVAADGITVNTLLPGRISTERIATLDAARAAALGATLDAVREAQNRNIPVGRSGLPAEFGAVAAFLASPLAAYVTGSTIRIDGGAVQSV